VRGDDAWRQRQLIVQTRLLRHAATALVALAVAAGLLRADLGQRGAPPGHSASSNPASQPAATHRLVLAGLATDGPAAPDASAAEGVSLAAYASASAGSVAGRQMLFAPEVERWRPLVAEHVPASLVDKALWTMNGESGGNPDAIGDDGFAVGLFQIHCSLAFAERPDADWLRDPENNVRYAAQQLGMARGDFSAWGEGTAGLPEWDPATGYGLFGALGRNPFPGEAWFATAAARRPVPLGGWSTRPYAALGRPSGHVYAAQSDPVTPIRPSAPAAAAGAPADGAPATNTRSPGAPTGPDAGSGRSTPVVPTTRPPAATPTPANAAPTATRSVPTRAPSTPTPTPTRAPAVVGPGQ
jgi:hypothetical protein